MSNSLHKPASARQAPEHSPQVSVTARPCDKCGEPRSKGASNLCRRCYLKEPRHRRASPKRQKVQMKTPAVTRTFSRNERLHARAIVEEYAPKMMKSYTNLTFEQRNLADFGIHRHLDYYRKLGTMVCDPDAIHEIIFDAKNNLSFAAENEAMIQATDYAEINRFENRFLQALTERTSGGRRVQRCKKAE